jgi:hypothetical protein
VCAGLDVAITAGSNSCACSALPLQGDYAFANERQDDYIDMSVWPLPALALRCLPAAWLHLGCILSCS